MASFTATDGRSLPTGADEQPSITTRDEDLVTAGCPLISDQPTSRIIMCAKSEWSPAIRREHALAMACAHAGIAVEFLEKPKDIRSLRALGLRDFARRGVGAVTLPSSCPGITIRPRTTTVPAHKGQAAQRLAGYGLGVVLAKTARQSGASDAIVVNAPWDWTGTDRLQAPRRVVDLADDWRVLIPERARQIEQMYARMEHEADAIIVASEQLREVFHRQVVVVPNAVGTEMLHLPVTTAQGRSRMAYVGTLSERFDAALIDEVLGLLPSWTLDLYGPCHYRGHEAEPGPALRELFRSRPQQVRWHGPVPRHELPSKLDAADVLVLPNDFAMSVGQDSMKLYDYAARGRPIVATTVPATNSDLPGVFVAPSAERFAAAVQAGGTDPDYLAAERREWAERNTWDRRLRPWLSAVLGTEARDPERAVYDGHEGRS